jgi:hypothetical protein
MPLDIFSQREFFGVEIVRHISLFLCPTLVCDTRELLALARHIPLLTSYSGPFV